MSRRRVRFALRAAAPLDVPLIAALHAESFEHGLSGEVWNEAAIGAILAMPGAYGLLAAAAGPDSAAAQGAPAGFLLGRDAADETEVLSIGVPQPWRRRGAGRALLRAAIDRARAGGRTRILLEAAEDNLPAHRLYESEGFAAIARRLAYYRRRPGGAATAVVFARDLA